MGSSVSYMDTRKVTQLPVGRIKRFTGLSFLLSHGFIARPKSAGHQSLIHIAPQPTESARNELESRPSPVFQVAVYHHADHDRPL